MHFYKPEKLSHFKIPCVGEVDGFRIIFFPFIWRSIKTISNFGQVDLDKWPSYLVTVFAIISPEGCIVRMENW